MHSPPLRRLLSLLRYQHRENASEDEQTTIWINERARCQNNI